MRSNNPPTDPSQYPNTEHEVQDKLALKITVIYALMGGSWILFSDRLLGMLVKNPEQIMLLAIFKGWFYVSVTAFIIYWLIDRDMQMIRKSQNKLKERDRKIWYQAYHDSLTGLPNRTFFMENLAEALTEAQKHNTLCAVIFIGLDFFKNINSSLGHNMGDKFLVSVTERLKASLGNKCLISRIGGDEFTVLLTDIKYESDAEAVALKTLDAFKECISVEGFEQQITVSVGVSIYPQDGQDITTLFKNAGLAMYSAKQTGRNLYMRYNDKISSYVLRKLAIESNLRRAIERNELSLRYQPLVNLENSQIIGLEALLRWNNQELGQVSPMEFISVAEESGLIIPIGEWVLYTACKQNQEWIEKGYTPLYISVNVSIRQLYRGNNFLESVINILRKTGLNAKYLTLEITESHLMQNADECIQVITDLRKLGIRIAIDDFGTGYSSLSYLKRLPIHAIKIDRSFIQDITIDEESAAITLAIINMAHSLGLNVVAEGIETYHQKDFLQKANCNEAQGFLFSIPLSAEDIEEAKLISPIRVG